MWHSSPFFAIDRFPYHSSQTVIQAHPRGTADMTRTIEEDSKTGNTPKQETHIQTTQIDTEEVATENYIKVPGNYRYVALACIVTLPLGTNWTQSSLGPLKNTLRTEWDISNAQFGVISSADAFVNTVFPILGGLVLDWWGPNIVTLCCTTIILVGSLIAAGSTITDMWRLLVGGHVLMGFGIAVLDSAQQKVRTKTNPSC